MELLLCACKQENANIIWKILNYQDQDCTQWDQVQVQMLIKINTEKVYRLDLKSDLSKNFDLVYKGQISDVDLQLSIWM